LILDRQVAVSQAVPLGVELAVARIGAFRAMLVATAKSGL